MNTIFNRGFSSEKLNYQDFFLVFNEHAILFSEGIPDSPGSWEEIFQRDEFLLSKLIAYFKSIDKKNFVSIKQLPTKETPTAWRIEGIWMEGYGKLCFAAGKWMPDRDNLSLLDQSLGRLIPQDKLLQEAELLAKTGSWRFLNAQRKVFLSPGLRKLFGLHLETESIAIRDFIHLVRSKDRAKVGNQLKKAIKTRKTTSGEFVYSHPDGKDRFISYRIQVNSLSPQNQLEVFGYCMDISDKKEIERNLQFESQILAQVKDPIFVTDLSFQIIYMNQAASKSSGVPVSFSGRIGDLYTLISGENKTLYNLFEETYLTGNWCGEVSLACISKQQAPFELSITLLKNPDKEVVGFSLIINNIAEKREREEMANTVKVIVEKSLAVMFRLDPKNHFEITFITENIKKYGYRAKDIIEDKTSFLDLIHPDDLPGFVQSFADLDNPVRIREYRIRQKNGNYKWIEDKASALSLEKGEAVCYEGLFQDITEKKFDRAEIERIKNQYRVLASNIPLTNVFLIDKNYTYLVAEGPNFDYWGLDKAYFEGKTIQQANTTNFDVILPLFETARKRKVTTSKELHYMNRVYKLMAKPIFSDEGLEYFLGIIQDISDEYHIKKALEKSELKYRNLVEESTELIFSINSSMELSYVSPNIKQFLDYETYEFTSGAFVDFLHPDDRKSLERFKEDPIMYFEHNPSFECRLKHRDGTFRIFSSSGKLIKDDQGKVRYYLGIARDITKLKETQKELFLAKNRAEAALTAKSQFLSVMSHEIRTPMNAVIGLSHLLLEDNPREDQLENLRTLQFSAENLLGLINDILDFNKIDSGKIELETVVFEPAHLLNRIVHSYTYQIREKALEIVLDIAPNLPQYIVGDPVRISQILNNLISNAVKFTKDGMVKISMRPTKQTDATVSIHFEVEDTGIGIPENKLDSIFEAFTQASSDTTRKYGGTGLGLAIVKKLIQLFGSDIYVKSTPSQGTIFWFELSFDISKQAKSSNQLTSGPLKDLNKTSLLVAEDNIVNQVLLRKYLIRWGVGNLEFANNGEKAVAMYMEGDFDILLLDLQMPVMDGFEVSNRIRQMEKENSSKRIPIIALTASSYSEVKEDIQEAGMDDYVSKPFVPANLYAKITKYL
ncbi:PAS domain S-box protein [Lunatibacter salilacus]|uniref:PAS domain S-box protein n=1 Tax=Lunatibacter salilacus TaxID=2483804 RepID=UPI00131A7E46|nr:PAS domain S-box protein [Lunatibacter salilacus]